MTDHRRGASTDKVIAHNVRSALNYRGLSNTDFGKALGLTPSTVTRKLSGGVTWSAYDLITASRVLRVPMTSLYASNGLISKA